MRSRSIIGTEVSITDYEEVLSAIFDAIDADERIYVCCTPASSLVYARDDSALRAALADAAIVTPDGMGVVHAARLLGEKIEDRVYGPDLMEMACDRAAASSTAIWLYGGTDEAALDQLTAALLKQHAGLRIAGSHSPPHRDLSDAELDDIAAKINADGHSIVWVGLGSPKQEIWMHKMRARLTAPVLVGVGAAFDFHAGRVAQAPAWMQKASLEWLYRVLQEPRRLGARYLKTLPRFVALVVRQKLRS